MTDPTTQSDPLAADHAAPEISEKIEAAGCCVTETAKDHVWLISGTLLLLGILIGAAATRATAPQPTLRNAARRSFRSAQRNTKQATRRVASHLPPRIRPEFSFADRFANVAEHLKLW